MIRKYMTLAFTMPHERVANSSSRPYYGAICRFEFKRGEIACVPQELINKYPDFAGLVNRQTDDKPFKFDVTGRVGHTIVHFLFTETYQTLPRPLDEEAEEPSRAFIEALEVYHQAVIHGLEELAELATNEIDRQGEGESFVNIVKGVECMFEGDKSWLVDYLAERAIMDDEEITETDIQELEDLNDDRNLVDILLKANMRLKFQLQNET